MRDLIIDCMRYWVEEMHVDGFRFDLAPVLGRDNGRFRTDAPFFKAVAAEPSLRYVKLIAEPWDIGVEGYQLAHFPAGWSEWNDLYRDTMRGFWRGNPGILGNFAERFAGSSDLFRASGRRPTASINYVACHDGFTLYDATAYNEKHNEANLEDNRDGHNHSLSWNCGVEGPTEDPAVTELRERQVRNMLATLVVSQGVPMLQAGDEFGRTQAGNNNAYCQDNEISWVNWDLGLAPRVAHRVRPAIAHVAQARARSATRHLPQGRAAGRSRAQGCELASSARPRDERGRLARRECARARRPDRPRVRGSAWNPERTSPVSMQHRRHARGLSLAGAEDQCRLAGGVRHRPLARRATSASAWPPVRRALFRFIPVYSSLTATRR